MNEWKVVVSEWEGQGVRLSHGVTIGSAAARRHQVLRFVPEFTSTEMTGAFLLSFERRIIKAERRLYRLQEAVYMITLLSETKFHQHPYTLNFPPN